MSAHPIRFQLQGPYRLQGSWLAPSNCLDFVDASFTPATIRSTPSSNDWPGMGPSTDHHGEIWGRTLGCSMLCSILLDMQQLSSLPLLLCLSAPAPPMDASLQGMVGILFCVSRFFDTPRLICPSEGRCFMMSVAGGVNGCMSSRSPVSYRLPFRRIARGSQRLYIVGSVPGPKDQTGRIAGIAGIASVLPPPLFRSRE